MEDLKEGDGEEKMKGESCLPHGKQIPWGCRGGINMGNFCGSLKISLTWYLNKN